MNLTCQTVVFRVSGRSDWHNQNITHSLLDQNAPNNKLHHNDDRHAQWEEPLSAVLMVWNVHRSTFAETKQRLMSCKIINGQMATSFSQFEVLGEHETDLIKNPCSRLWGRATTSSNSVPCQRRKQSRCPPLQARYYLAWCVASAITNSFMFAL